MIFCKRRRREDRKRGDYSDPGWYRQPAGTVAYEWTAEPPQPLRSNAGGRADHAGQKQAGR